RLRPAPLPVPAARAPVPADLPLHHVPAADHAAVALPDPGPVPALQLARRARARLRRHRAPADDLPPARVLRPDPERARGGGAHRRLQRLGDVLAGDVPDGATGGGLGGLSDLPIFLDLIT